MCAIIHHVSPPGPWQPYDGGDFSIWHTNTAAGGDTGHALLLWRRWRQSQVAKNLNPKLHSAIVIPRVNHNTPQSRSYCWKWRKDIENRANFLHRSPSKQCWSLTQLWTVGETCCWLSQQWAEGGSIFESSSQYLSPGVEYRQFGAFSMI